jgi:hypothetical protein
MVEPSSDNDRQGQRRADGKALLKYCVHTASIIGQYRKNNQSNLPSIQVRDPDSNTTRSKGLTKYAPKRYAPNNGRPNAGNVVALDVKCIHLPMIQIFRDFFRSRMPSAVN